MQYHLDGFAPGDPALLPVAPDVPPTDARPSDEVDVLVVGCGPAGLTLATQLSAFPDITTRIVEQKLGPLQFGQADGVACRSMEMFEAFGFSERVLKESYWVNETSFWRPDPALPRNVARADRIQDVEDGLSEFPHVILSQARIHDFYLETMLRSPRRLAPDYGRRFVDLTIADEVEHTTRSRRRSSASIRSTPVRSRRCGPGISSAVTGARALYGVRSASSSGGTPPASCGASPTCWP